MKKYFFNSNYCVEMVIKIYTLLYRFINILIRIMEFYERFKQWEILKK